MKTEITLLKLADMINAHLAKGGLVMDSYRGGCLDPISEARLDDWDGREDNLLHLCGSDLATGWTNIPDTDRLEVHGHEVHYFSDTDYCGKVVFLNPAPVEP